MCSVFLVVQIYAQWWDTCLVNRFNFFKSLSCSLKKQISSFDFWLKCMSSYRHDSMGEWRSLWRLSSRFWRCTWHFRWCLTFTHSKGSISNVSWIFEIFSTTSFVHIKCNSLEIDNDEYVKILNMLRAEWIIINACCVFHLWWLRSEINTEITRAVAFLRWIVNALIGFSIMSCNFSLPYGNVFVDIVIRYFHVFFITQYLATKCFSSSSYSRFFLFNYKVRARLLIIKWKYVFTAANNSWINNNTHGVST